MTICVQSVCEFRGVGHQGRTAVLAPTAVPYQVIPAAGTGSVQWAKSL
jgi:hypothetical protein